MTDSLMRVAERAFNTPLLIDPGKAKAIYHLFAARGVGGLGAATEMQAPPDVQAVGWATGARASSLLGDELAGAVAARANAYAVRYGIAVIPVTGTLVRRGAWIGENMSGATSYEGLAAQLRGAAQDSAVRGIALEIDSYGGEAHGLFDLTRLIREVRQVKPVRAFVADHALSAAYGIAAQADRIVVGEHGHVGSVGVVCMHVDLSGEMEQRGRKVTLIHSGARKVDGNPFEPLSDDVRRGIQADNDALWVDFAGEVAAGRGRLSAEALLRMEAGVWRGGDAVARGLADEVQALAASFEAWRDSLDGGAVASQSSPAFGRGATGAAALSNEKEAVMADTQTAPAADQPETSFVADGSAIVPPASAEQAVKVERERAGKIFAKAAKAGVSPALAQELVAQGVSLEVAYERILDAKAEASADGGDIVNIAPGSVRVTGDQRDRAKAGLEEALLARTGLGGARNEFSGMQLREMARVALVAQGGKPPMGGVQALASAAFVPTMAGAMHSTSDFGEVLSNVANKAMMKGFEEAPEIFERFTSVGTMSDFKPTKRVGLDTFPALSKVEEGAEFTYGTMGETGETAVLATYGKLFAITRQAIINDDLDAFSRVPMKMGRAARRTVGDLVFAVFSANANMSDGVALFAAAHGNLASSASGPSELAINAAITAMATQSDATGSAVLNIAPRFLLAPPKWRSHVLQSLNSEYAPDDTDKAGSTKQSRAYNTVRGAAEPLFDARLTGDAWYMLADPNAYDTIEVGYLDGVSTPFMDQQDGWSVDGTEFKVRIDATATALAWQTMFKNAGS